MYKIGVEQDHPQGREYQDAEIESQKESERVTLEFSESTIWTLFIGSFQILNHGDLECSSNQPDLTYKNISSTIYIMGMATDTVLFVLEPLMDTVPGTHQPLVVTVLW